MPHWPESDRALVRRGSLTIWFDAAWLREHGRPAPTGQRGAPCDYSDIAIQGWLPLKAVFDLPSRLVEGLAGSIVQLMGVELRIPDPPLLSRRAKTLPVSIPRRQRTGPVPVVVDSTGLKRYGDGEWKGRQHLAGKRRTWRKVHVAFDADATDVIGVEVTTQEWPAGDVLAGLLEQGEGDIAAGGGDGADDRRGVDDAARERGATVAVPPRDNAVPWEQPHPRTQALAVIVEKGLAEWKKSVGYHRRRIAANGMYRLTHLLGERLASRLVDPQVIEVHARVAALNVMPSLGLPGSVRAGGSLS